MASDISLSVIIPVWNEERRLPRLFHELERFFSNSFKGLSIKEVLFVDDGSTDKSGEFLADFSRGRAARVISYAGNKGKGYAVREGMKSFAGDYCLIADADVSTPFEEVIKFLPHIQSGAPAVIGTRKTSGAEVIIHQPFYREKMGQVYTWLARLVTGVPVTDFTCGFKVFRRDAARRIAGESFINRWSYDAEIIFLASKFGFGIKEVPVSWSNDRRTAVRILRDSARSFFDLIRLRARHLY